MSSDVAPDGDQEDKTKNQDKQIICEQTEKSALSGNNLDKESGAISEENETSQPGKSADSVSTDEVTKETIDFKLVYNKQKYDINFTLDETVAKLKQHLETLTGVPASMQKLMFKGKMRDKETLREHDIKKNAKIMLVGSTVSDVMSVGRPDMKALKEEEKKEKAASKELLSKQKPHKTVLDKHGKPDDAIPGIKHKKDPLPPQPLSGMYNKSGGKVRLTFKLENDQLWIGTKERTDKIQMSSIKSVVSEKLDGHEEYHMLAFQLGPTEASRYWVYWVPAQYVDSIKDAVLGKFPFF